MAGSQIETAVRGGLLQLSGAVRPYGGIGPGVGSQIQCRLAQAGNGQAGGAVMARHQAYQLADGPGAADEHPFAGDRAGAFDALQRDRKRLEQGPP